MKILGPFCLSFALAWSLTGCKASVPKHGLEFIFTARSTNGTAMNPDEFQRLAGVLQKRADALGFPPSYLRVESNSFRLKFDPDSKEQIEEVRTTMIRNGFLQFRLGHPDGEKLLAQGIVPGDYQVLVGMHLTPGGKVPQSHLVSRMAVAGLDNRNLVRAALGRDKNNGPEIYFQLNPEGAAVLAQVTGENVGRVLAIVVDGQLYSAPRIRTPITGGSATISGEGILEREAFSLATILQYPLEGKVEIMEERRF